VTETSGQKRLNNVYDDPAYSSVVKKMKKELSWLQAKYGDTEIPVGKKNALSGNEIRVSNVKIDLRCLFRKGSG
jgi:hypothetical protein